MVGNNSGSGPGETPTEPDLIADLVGNGVERDEAEESTAICPLVADSGNRRVLREWLDDHDDYHAVDPGAPPFEPDFGLCIIDDEALREHSEELERLKQEAEPVLLPVLLLLPETRSDVIDTDRGEVADNVFPTTVDEIVSLPIRQTELEWRITSLLRLRAQSITSQARNEELQLFREAVESTGHAVYITDTDGTIKYVNEMFEEITGYTREEAVGQTPQILHSREMSDEFFETLWATIESGEVWHGDIVDRRKNGELYTASQTIAPVSRDDETIAFVAVQNDITERKAQEKRLKRRTHAIDEAPVGITITDPDLEDNPMIYVNDAFVEMTGYPREEAVGRNCRFLQGEGTDPDRVATIRRAIDAEEPVSAEIRNYRKDGTEFWNHLEIAPVRDDAGAVMNYVGFQRDVTERKQRMRQLGVLDRTLRHNLRNDINVIGGRAETILSGDSEDVAAAAETIVEKSDQLVATAEKEQTITALLQDPPKRIRADLSSMIPQLATKKRSERPEAVIDVTCPDETRVSVSSRFETAVDELLENAIAHNDAPTPEVAVVVTETAEGVCIEIVDNGPRISEMERTVLQDDQTPKPLYHATGLGLWLVKLIVTRSGGTIEFDENSDRGNVIRVNLFR